MHNVTASYNVLGVGGVPTAGSEISGHPEDKWGGAVNAALQIKNIPTGPGDDFKIDQRMPGATPRPWSPCSAIAELRDVWWYEPSGCVSEHWLWSNF